MRPETADIGSTIDEVYRRESRRVFATLIRLLGDFDLAEEALHDAFIAAVERWPQEGIPKNPRSWLISAGRFRAIDTIRRRSRFDASLEEIAARLSNNTSPGAPDDESVEDDRLRLIFTCCHPSLPASTQVAMTLREVCALTTEDIAAAFLSTPSTIAQRIVRGKAKIRNEKIPYEVPAVSELPKRLDSLLSVIYLVFNEGYNASSGDALTKPDLSAEAIRLCRLVAELHTDPEVIGLLALMLLHESRRPARTSDQGDIILLEEQDRTQWNHALIQEGSLLVQQAIQTRRFGSYTIQAAISAVHAQSPTAGETDWQQIVQLYDLLSRANPSPVIQLNRAVAIAMRDGPQQGIEIIDGILKRGELANYHLAYAARADLFRRLGKSQQALEDYRKALSLTKQGPEQRFLQRRIDQLQ